MEQRLDIRSGRLEGLTDSQARMVRRRGLTVTRLYVPQPFYILLVYVLRMFYVKGTLGLFVYTCICVLYCLRVRSFHIKGNERV